jgi:N-acetylglucosamine-6-phosphate deacetylase
MHELAGSILTDDGWRRGRIRYDGHVRAVDGRPIDAPRPPYVVPGFVDLHVHGGGGADVMTGEAAVRRTAMIHARHGTTALVATTVTAPSEDIAAALAGIEAVRRAPAAGEAQVLGAHLEGPFLNPDKLGAQPPYARAPAPALLGHWAETARVLLVTYAPECDPETLLPGALGRLGIRGQLGHSLADDATARRALDAGMGVTHLFNAMSGLDHRAPGVVGAALAVAAHAEIIPDLVHVAPTALLAARRAIPGLYGVTDATAGAGMPAGDYPLGRYTAAKHGDVMRLADGRLAGSALTMDSALRNLVALGLELDEAVRRLSTLPADRLGRDDLGRIAAGRRADLVVLDADLEVQQVIVGGDDAF